MLLGKHKAAIDMYEEAQRITAPDWEIMHNKGMCLVHLRQYERWVGVHQGRGGYKVGRKGGGEDRWCGQRPTEWLLAGGGMCQREEDPIVGMGPG